MELKTGHVHHEGPQHDKTEPTKLATTRHGGSNASNPDSMSEAEETNSVVDGDAGTNLATERQESFNRLQDKWLSILEKYGNEAEEEDENTDVVDLRSWEIEVDNGHLSSLKRQQYSIWNDPYARHPTAQYDGDVENVDGDDDEVVDEENNRGSEKTKENENGMQGEGKEDIGNKTPTALKQLANKKRTPLQHKTSNQLEEDAFESLLTPSPTATRRKFVTNGSRNSTPATSPSPRRNRADTSSPIKKSGFNMMSPTKLLFAIERDTQLAEPGDSERESESDEEENDKNDGPLRTIGEDESMDQGSDDNGEEEDQQEDDAEEEQEDADTSQEILPEFRMRFSPPTRRQTRRVVTSPELEDNQTRRDNDNGNDNDEDVIVIDSDVSDKEPEEKAAAVPETNVPGPKVEDNADLEEITEAQFLAATQPTQEKPSPCTEIAHYVETHRNPFAYADKQAIVRSQSLAGSSLANANDEDDRIQGICGQHGYFCGRDFCFTCS